MYMASFTNSKDIAANCITLLSGNETNDTTTPIAAKANTATTQRALNIDKLGWHSKR